MATKKNNQAIDTEQEDLSPPEAAEPREDVTEPAAEPQEDVTEPAADPTPAPTEILSANFPTPPPIAGLVKHSGLTHIGPGPITYARSNNQLVKIVDKYFPLGKNERALSTDIRAVLLELIQAL